MGSLLLKQFRVTLTPGTRTTRYGSREFHCRSQSAKKLAATLKWKRGWVEGRDFTLEEVPMGDFS